MHAVCQRNREHYRRYYGCYVVYVIPKKMHNPHRPRKRDQYGRKRKKHPAYAAECQRQDNYYDKDDKRKKYFQVFFHVIGIKILDSPRPGYVVVFAFRKLLF